MATLTPLSNAKRVVIKIGSALLVDGGGLRRDWLGALVEDVARLRARGVDVLIVSSGSMALGRKVLGLPDGALLLEQLQAAAAIGQIALAQAYQEALGAHNINAAQILLTSEDGENRRRYLNTRATLMTLLELGAVPIINENDTVATDEIRFGDNDRLAAQLAAMAGADVLVLLSDVDGVYSANPKTNPDAEHFPLIDAVTPEIEAMADGKGSMLSSGGMTTKLQAAKTAMAGGVAMAIAIGDVTHPIAAIEKGARATWFVPKTDAHAARKNWIMAMKPRGVVEIDDGALAALGRGSSLLAAGCRAVRGEFHRGDAVDILAGGKLVARGLIGYDAAEARDILGAKSNEIEARLGHAGRGSMVHRDNLVMV